METKWKQELQRRRHQQQQQQQQQRHNDNKCMDTIPFFL
jgi:hypothetical protein